MRQHRSGSQPSAWKTSRGLPRSSVCGVRILSSRLVSMADTEMVVAWVKTISVVDSAPPRWRFSDVSIRRHTSGVSISEPLPEQLGGLGQNQLERAGDSHKRIRFYGDGASSTRTWSSSMTRDVSRSSTGHPDNGAPSSTLTTDCLLRPRATGSAASHVAFDLLGLAAVVHVAPSAAVVLRPVEEQPGTAGTAFESR